MNISTPLRLRTILLEDEPDNREWLLKKLALYPELEMVGWAESVDEAYALIAREKPDAAFMDVQLIGGDAFQLLARLKDNGLPIPYIVMATGYPEYVMSALNDYRRFIVQYLLKPFVENWQQKFRKSIDALMAAKLNDAIQLAPNEPIAGPASTQNSIFINNRGSLLRIDFDKINYLEVAGGGESIIVTDTETHQVDITLNKFQELLPADRFVRISRTNMACISKIDRINKEDRMLDVRTGAKHKSLGIGDNYYTDLLKTLPVVKDGQVKQAAPLSMASAPVVERSGPAVERNRNAPTLLERDVAGKIQSLQDERTELFIEKQKSENLLRNILPAEVAEELKQTGETTAQRYELVTVLFADIKDFTRIAEEMSPEDLVREIDHCFRQFDQIAQRFRIEKIKTIGDCYMCAGGLPKADEDNPVRTVEAAIEMQRFLASYKTERETAGLPVFEARIGIHSGPVVAGVVGQQKFSYDIWGDTVNTAARLEQAGQAGKICISAATYERVKRHFSCRFAGTVEAKNKGVLEVYFVEN